MASSAISATPAEAPSPAAPAAAAGDAPRLVAYGSLSFAVTFVVAPLNAFLPAAYAELTGLSLAAIGIAFALGRLWDGLVDPAIGMVCDRVETPWGKRKPWVALGATAAVGSIYLLMNPPETGAFAWLLGGLFLVYTFGSLWQIPYLSWGAEVLPSYDGRSRVAAFREFFTLAAGVAIPLVPLLVLGATAATPARSLQLIATIGLFLVPLAALLSIAATPATHHGSEARPAVSVRSYAAILRDNTPLRRYLVAICAIVLAYGCFDATMILFFRDILGLSDKFLLLILARQVIALMFVPVAGWLARRYEKSTLLLTGILFLVLTFAMLGLTPRGSFGLALAAYALNGVMATMLVVVPAAMLADVADYGELRRGRAEMAQHYSMLTFIQKLPHAAGPAIALTLLGAAGYVPGAAANPQVELYFRLIALGVPAVLVLIAAVALWRFPITRRRHELIRRRIERRGCR